MSGSFCSFGGGGREAPSTILFVFFGSTTHYDNVRAKGNPLQGPKSDCVRNPNTSPSRLEQVVPGREV